MSLDMTNLTPIDLAAELLSAACEDVISQGYELVPAVFDGHNPPGSDKKCCCLVGAFNISSGHIPSSLMPLANALGFDWDTKGSHWATPIWALIHGFDGDDELASKWYIDEERDWFDLGKKFRETYIKEDAIA